MTGVLQRPLALKLNQRTVLVKVDSVMDVRGVSADVVYDLADGPAAVNAQPEERLRWVWNLAVNPAGDKRDLRFWAREVLAPETTAGLELDDVIDLLLGDRKNFHAGEMCHLLRVRRPTLLDLRDELRGRLNGGPAFFGRAGVERFLRSRWLGKSVVSSQRSVATEGTA